MSPRTGTTCSPKAPFCSAVMPVVSKLKLQTPVARVAKHPHQIPTQPTVEACGIPAYVAGALIKHASNIKWHTLHNGGMLTMHMPGFIGTSSHSSGHALLRAGTTCTVVAHCCLRRTHQHPPEILLATPLTLPMKATCLCWVQRASGCRQ